LHLLADCPPTESCQRLDTKYISTALYLPATSSSFLSYFYTFMLFFHLLVSRRDAAFLLQKRPISFESLSFSSLLILFCIIPLRQFLERSRLSNKRPGETSYLLRPLKTSLRSGERERVVAEGGRNGRRHTNSRSFMFDRYSYGNCVICRYISWSKSYTFHWFLIIQFPLSVRYH
jgi:hypothetical protein